MIRWTLSFRCYGILGKGEKKRKKRHGMANQKRPCTFTFITKESNQILKAKEGLSIISQFDDAKVNVKGNLINLQTMLLFHPVDMGVSISL
jgi:hypothetical protein